MENISKLIDIAKETAPEIWRIAMLQVRANTIETIFWLVILTLMLLLFSIATVNFYKSISEDESDTEITLFVVTLLLGLFVLATLIVNIVTLVHLLVNPEYYAIQDIIVGVK